MKNHTKQTLNKWDYIITLSRHLNEFMVHLKWISNILQKALKELTQYFQSLQPYFFFSLYSRYINSLMFFQTVRFFTILLLVNTVLSVLSFFFFPLLTLLLLLIFEVYRQLCLILLFNSNYWASSISLVLFSLGWDNKQEIILTFQIFVLVWNKENKHISKHATSQLSICTIINK